MNKIKPPSLAVQLVSANAEIDIYKSSADAAVKEMLAHKDLSRQRGEYIKLFKSERIQMEREIAELRGYLARVLEDDRVREDAQPAEPQVSDAELEESRQTMNRAARQREFPVPRRTGPSSLSSSGPVWNAHQWDGCETDRFGREKPRPTHWQERD